VVGKIALSVNLENSIIKSGDSATLNITISGSGNISDAESPSITPPEGFKVYSDTPETDIITTSRGFSGKKTFKAVLVALKPGEYTIGPVKFPYFNTEKQAYEMLTSKPFTISVKPSESTTSASAIETETSEQITERKIIKKKIEYTGHDILPLKEDISTITNQKQLSIKGHILILVSPLLLTVLIIILSGFLQKEKNQKTIFQKKVKALLKTASTENCTSEDFLATVYKALVYAIGSNSDASGESLTKKEAEAILTKKKNDENTISEILTLFDNIESLRFSGQKITPDDKKNILHQTKSAVRRIS
jgi:hypothetical protein